MADYLALSTEQQHTLRTPRTLLPGSSATTAKPSRCCRCKEPPIIYPESAAWLTFWDLYMAVLLLIVVFLAPVETAFLEPELNLLFFANRFMDLSFCADL